MKITIHRGFRELGGCLIEIRSNKARILVDMGYTLIKDGIPLQSYPARQSSEEAYPDRDGDTESVILPQTDVLPVIDGLFRWDKPTFDAVILARVDLDHDHLLQWLHPDIPVWLSASTKTLIEQAHRFRLISPYNAEFQLFSPSRSFTIRDISILPHQLDHALCDVSAFEISSDGRSILYAGDFSGSVNQASCLGTFSRQAAKQADLLLVDGAMFERNNTHNRTEEEIEQELVALMAEPGPFFFQCSSQHIGRIITFYNACRNTQRQFIIDPFTANVLHEMRKLGYSLPSPGVGSDAMHVFSPRRHSRQQPAESGMEEPHRFSRWQVSRMQVTSMADRVCMLVRPSLLTDLRKMPALRGGQLVFSMLSAFRSTLGQKRLEHLMLARGTTLVPLHTGGHARIADLDRLVDNLQPKKVLLISELQPELKKRLHNPIQVLQDHETIEI